MPAAKPTPASGQWIVQGVYWHTEAGGEVPTTAFRLVIAESQMKTPANVGTLLRGISKEKLAKAGFKASS